MTRMKPLLLSERARHIAATTGVVLWLVFPIVYMAGTRARWSRRCDGRSFTGEFDECFNDALPVLEVGAFPITLALAYLFARFSFSMFAPGAELRSRKWRLAGPDGGGDVFPLHQLLSLVGLVWTSLHVASLPLSLSYWYLLAYWLAWLAWFLIGAWSSLPNNARNHD